jgi:hypothetical protein
MMEAASTAETSVNFYHATWRYNPEDSHLHVRTVCEFIMMAVKGLCLPNDYKVVLKVTIVEQTTSITGAGCSL